jgi:NADH:ubiquinone reductase (H+-translocating)
VQASPAAEWIGTRADRLGRVVVDEDLFVLGQANIFAIGDTAACPDGAGGTLPGVAPVAKQQGRYVAERILGQTMKPFRYRDYGNLATIGRRRAVAHFGMLRISGFPAWLLWCVAHIYFLAGFRNRLSVGLHWAWSYFTYGRSARLITGPIDDVRDDSFAEAA